MKLFVYGEFGPMALENSLLPTWQNDPAIEEVIPITRLSLPSPQEVLERGLRRFWPERSPQIKAHNAYVLRTIELHHIRVSALLVFKGMELFPSTLENIRARGVVLFCYNPDHPFVYSGRGSGSEFMRRSLPLYRTYFTYHPGAHSQLKASGVPSEWVPFGHEDAAAKEPLVKEGHEKQRGCFIGNPNPFRVQFFNELEGRVPIDLFGNGWAKYFKKSKHIRVHGPVHGAEHWRNMAKYRFQLNVMAEHNADAHNMRTFSAPAAGAIMVAPRNPDHERFFVDGKEVLLYDHVDHCIELCQALLRLTFHEALDIRIAARQRSLNSGYAYHERAQTLLQHMIKAIH